MPWFVIYPLGRGFSYGGVGDQYKGSQWIIQNLVDCVAKGGNFMVGVGPDGHGRFSPTAVQQLKEVGQWLAINGEAIYDTRSRAGDLWKEGARISFADPKSEKSDQPQEVDNLPIRFTRRKDERALYAICLAWPGSDLYLETVQVEEISKVTMLGMKTSLRWSKDTRKGMRIEIPLALQDKAKRPCNVAWTFKLEAKAR